MTLRTVALRVPLTLSLVAGALACDAQRFGCPAGTQIVMEGAPSSGRVFCGKTMPDGSVVPHGYYVEHGENKQRILAQYANGYRHGKLIRHGPGRVKVEVTRYVGGQRHGKLMLLHPSGKPHVVQYFRNGQRHGKLVVKGASGKDVVRGAFDAGKPHGEWTYFDAAGNKRLQVRYAHGEVVDRVRAWDASGAWLKTPPRPPPIEPAPPEYTLMREGDL